MKADALAVAQPVARYAGVGQAEFVALVQQQVAAQCGQKGHQQFGQARVGVVATATRRPAHDVVIAERPGRPDAGAEHLLDEAADVLGAQWRLAWRQHVVGGIQRTRREISVVAVARRLDRQLSQRMPVGPRGHALLQPAHEAQVVRPRAVVQMKLRVCRHAPRRAAGCRRVVAQLRVDHRQVDHVQPEAVDAAREPEVGHLEQCVLHLRQVDVEVRHLRVEVRQVVLLAHAVPLPRRPAEDRLPVVRRRAVGLGVGPHIPVATRVISRAAALLEPGVTVRGVGVDLIDQHAQPKRMGAGEQRVEVGQRAQPRVDVAMRLHVVAEVVHRRWEERAQPQAVDTQAGDMVQLPQHAGQVTPAVAIGIVEAQRVDLVQRGSAPPGVGHAGLLVGRVRLSSAEAADS